MLNYHLDCKWAKKKIVIEHAHLGKRVFTTDIFLLKGVVQRIYYFSQCLVVTTAAPFTLKAKMFC